MVLCLYEPDDIVKLSNLHFCTFNTFIKKNQFWYLERVKEIRPIELVINLLTTYVPII